MSLKIMDVSKIEIVALMRLRKRELLSKEFFATVLTTMGTVASWLLGVPLELEGVIIAGGAPVLIGGLFGERNKYLKEKQAVMKKHSMAYLFEARRLGELK